MLRLPRIMHHIALCTPYITLVNCGHLLHIQLDDAKPEMKIQAEQVRWVFEGPHASSGEDTYLDWIKATLGASDQCPCLLF
jgi:hypothetical protein